MDRYHKMLNPSPGQRRNPCFSFLHTVSQNASGVPNGPDPVEQNSQRLGIERSKSSLVTRDYQNRPESKAVSVSPDSQENPETVCRLADYRGAKQTRTSAG